MCAPLYGWCWERHTSAVGARLSLIALRQLVSKFCRILEWIYTFVFRARQVSQAREARGGRRRMARVRGGSLFIFAEKDYSFHVETSINQLVAY